MAKTHADFLQQAKAVKTVAEEFRDLWFNKMRPLIVSHNAEDYTDAGDTPKPIYLNEDANGDIDGSDYPRASYMDAINFINQIENLMTNQAVAQGDYKTTMAKVWG